MKKSKVDEYLAKYVTVKIDDNTEYNGFLEKGQGYEDGYYHCKQESNGKDNHWFRSSHIKSIKRFTLD